MEQVFENPEFIEIDISSAAHVLDLQKLMNPNHQLTALLILNQRINVPQIFEKLWNNYNLKVCADGGANRLYEYFTTEKERLQHLPDYIIGDLDSIDQKVYDFYQKHMVKIIKQTTQYSTDFTKSVNLISLHFYSKNFRTTVENGSNNFGISLDHGIHDMYHQEVETLPEKEKKKIHLLALNAIDGRFDQTVHSITQLYTLASTDSYFQLCYLTPTDLIFLVPAGGTLVKYSQDFRSCAIGNCGLLPLGGPTMINKTKGLKWDVENWSSSIAEGKVSSSNRFVGSNGCYMDVESSVVMNVELKIENLNQFL